MNNSCIITYENRIAKSDNDYFYINYTKLINKRYCDQMGYTYIFDTQYNKHIPAYWIKVDIVLEYMKLYKDKYKYYMWIDSDAFVYNNKKLDDFFDDENIIFVSSNEPNILGNSYINSGVYIVKYSEEGLKFMEDWMKGWDPSKWCFEEWSKQWRFNGAWAGIIFEQGYVSYLAQTGRWVDKVKIYDWNIMCNMFRDDDETNKNTFTRHFMTIFKDKIYKYMYKYENNMEMNNSNKIILKNINTININRGEIMDIYNERQKHYEIWKNMVENDIKYMVINSKNKKTREDITIELDEDIDIYFTNSEYLKMTLSDKIPKIYHNGKGICTEEYFITIKGAKKLIKYYQQYELDNKNIESTIDNSILNWINDNHDVKYGNIFPININWYDIKDLC